jgi:hypothetical protein
MAPLAGGPVVTAFQVGSDSEVPPVREIWVSHLIRARPILSLLSSGVVRSAYRCSHGKSGPFSTIRDSRPQTRQCRRHGARASGWSMGHVALPEKSRRRTRQLVRAIDGPCRQLVRSWAASGNKCERQRTRPTHDENTAPDFLRLGFDCDAAPSRGSVEGKSLSFGPASSSRASAPLFKVVIVRSRAPQLG